MEKQVSGAESENLDSSDEYFASTGGMLFDSERSNIVPLVFLQRVTDFLTHRSDILTYVLP